MNTFYSARWSRLLIIVSAVMTILLIGVSIGLVSWKPAGFQAHWLSWLPMVLLVACLPFVIRGYTVTDDAILIRRLCWETRLPLAGLESVTHVPDAMRGSLRLCGNGGMYSFTGFYWNKSLRSYRAFVTDTRRTVVLKFRGKTVVVSPVDPEEFARELETRTGLLPMTA